MIDTLLFKKIISGFQLPLDSIHGLSHWKHVEKIGKQLAIETKADFHVITYFAYLHDSKRLNENEDPLHGERAASFVKEIMDKGLLRLNNNQQMQLIEACRIHSYRRAKTKDITVATCLDADRLDLIRLGITPDPQFLLTEAGKHYRI